MGVKRSSDNRRSGHSAVMCVEHAYQAVRHIDPSGPCSPSESWLGGSGQKVTCDVVANPDRVAAYLIDGFVKT